MARDLRPLHQSFIAGRSRHVLFPALLAAGCLIAYLLQPRSQQPNGGTWLGYTLGTIAALLVLLLMGYGIRRRVFGAALRRLICALPVRRPRGPRVALGLRSGRVGASLGERPGHLGRSTSYVPIRARRRSLPTGRRR